ncbi:MAG: glycine oxidase ThiO [Planctomycetota bacterium]|nr:glycine oxidase ThiO [Planctomycetota bacterium]MDA1162230.1 glycine oxidase ThiO [Planctomycetota bacterium]
MSDVIVVGGGVIGLSIAWELASHGAIVKVLDQSTVGREASWAGAGMLPPGNLAGERTGEGRLRALSCVLWPEWSEGLLAATGIDNGYRNCGAIEVSFDRNLDDEASAWEATGNKVEILSAARRRHLEPAISSNVKHSYRLPEFCQVRNPRHLRSLEVACLDMGVELLEGEPVCGWKATGQRVTHARTVSTDYAAAKFVIASGAWSRQLANAVGTEISIEPLRGQIVLLRCSPLPFRHVIQDGARYLVPREDGRILIGSTEERAGFVKQNTVEGVQSLLQFAKSVVPTLADAEIERTWSGLRPYSGREEPFIGRLPNQENLFVAAGHFRSGLQMSPGTAVLVRQMLHRQESSIPMAPYDLLHDSSDGDETEAHELLSAPNQVVQSQN